MRALQITEYGDNSVLTIAEVALPAPVARQVLIDVEAAALNPLDATLRAGYAQALMPLRFPATLGGDVAGVVAGVGPDVTEFAVGDRVYGNAYTLLGGSGAIAEQALVQADNLAPIPVGLDFVDAASMPVAGTTAVEAIDHSLKVQSGQRVFISGGSGAVGSAAVQLAKHLGAYVATTASGDGVDLARALGGDEVFDHASSDFSEHLSDFDAVLDGVGGASLDKAYGILRRGGTLVSVSGEIDQAQADQRGLKVIRQGAQSDGVLRELTAYLADGVITPRVGRTYPLEEAVAAFAALENRSVRGKIVIVP
ncbi:MULTISPECIES: NADP-dependent oxidoreductase [unclassified Microbacterium]|uniref:NADP-dependent oxidoreductase n=1 Tax=unclassified Microbacterium TaxID=2609290 RepID=UPI001DDA39C1|nr:NADP-dependent oxidoreductase [Actinomycetota bacterium]